MFGSRLYRVAFLVFGLAAIAGTVRAQSGVDGLSAQMSGKTVTVRIQGLRLSHSLLFKGVDTRIADGAIQKRAFGTQSAKDEVLNPGDQVRVTKVEGATDKNNDLLRVTIAAADGLTVPVAFVLPKGSLAGQSESQLVQIVGTVFDLPGAGAPAAQGRFTPGRSAAPPAVVSGWRIVPGKNGNQGSIAGSARNGAQRSTAQLRLDCSGAEVRVHKNVAPDLSALSCEGDRDSANLLKFKVGDHAEEAGGICYDTDPAATAFVALPVDLGAGGLNEVIAAAGAPIRFTFDMGTTPASQLVADFELPKDASTIAFLSSCAKPNYVPAEDAKNVVVACPALDGKGLRGAQVLTANGKKYVGGQNDNDVGAEWTILKATKAHPVRPKLMLECSYGNGLKQIDTSETLEKKLIPIPASATSCVARGSAELGEMYASCTGQ